MSKISLGTVQFGIKYGLNPNKKMVNEEEVNKILNYAKLEKIDLLDTAPSYGISEKILGKLDISNFKVVTKTRHFDNNEINENDLKLINIDFQNSLKNLKTNNIYAILIHNSNDLLKVGSEKLYEYLLILKKEKKVNKIGVSVYDPIQLKSIINNFDIDIVQLPLNIIDRRMIEDDILSILRKKKIEIHARSIFLQGLLLMDNNEIPKKFNEWRNLWKIWHQWLYENELTALQATIRFVNSIPEVSRVIVGVESEFQLKEIMIASKGLLPKLPNGLFSNDLNLLNPTNWNKL